MTGIDGLGCSEERYVQGNGKGVSRNLWKINSYEGKIEIIRRSRKENARYLDLLCSDTIWKRGREKVEPRPLADTLVLFTKFSSRFLFFLSKITIFESVHDSIFENKIIPSWIFRGIVGGRGSV